MKRILTLGGLGVLLCGFLVSSAVAAENVKEAWRSAYGTPYAVSVNSTDGSVWAATGNSVMHVTKTGTIQKQVNGFYSPRALVVDQSDGTVWVADTGHNQVVKLSGSGDELLRLDGFSGPTSLDVDSDASTPIVWVADTANNRVVQLNASTGAELWHSDAGVLSAPRSVSANTYLHTCWVADTGNNRIVQLDTDGTQLGAYTGFSAPASVAVKAQDWHPIVWVADTGNNRLVELDENGAQTKVVTEFNGPQAVSVDASTGLCWAMDTGNHQVVHLTTDGSTLFRGGPFDTPSSVVTNNADGSCWVGDTVKAEVTHLAAVGTVLAQKALLTVSPISAVGAPDGTVWIGVQSDWDSTAAKYHGYVRHIGLDGSVLADQEVCQVPAFLARAADGTVWVCDTRINKVLHLDTSANILWQSADGAFSSPARLAVNQTTGDIWVPDKYHNQIVRLSSAGTELGRYSGYSSVNEISINPNDNSIWAAVLGLDTVAHLSEGGTLLDAYSTFNAPSGVAVDPADGTLWVGDHDAVYHVNTDGTVIWQSADYAGGHDMVLNATDGTVAFIGWSYVTILSADHAEIWNSYDYGNSCVGLCPDNSYWVGDDSTNTVRHLAADGQVMMQLSGFRQPSSVANLTSDKSAWVADTGNSRVVHLGFDGSQVSQNAGTAGLSAPVAVSVDQTHGQAWVVDKTAGKLLSLNSDGSLGTPTPATGLASPQSVSADSTTGDVWIGVTNQVGKYNSSAVQQFLGGTFGNKPLVAAYPTDGSVWVADTANNQVVHLSATGSAVGSAITGLTAPSAITVNTSDGSIWVADSTKVYHYSSSGGAIGSPVTGFHAPTGLAVNTTDNSVWVADTGGGAVIHLKSDGTESWRGTEFVTPASLSVIPSDGTVWVTDVGLNQVVKLVPAPAADFDATPVRGVGPLNVTFTDKSTGNPTTWSWSFGDSASGANNTSTAQNPTHSYTAVGAYTVALTVGNGLFTDTMTKQNFINVGTANPPTADFSATPLTGTAPLAVQFTDLTTNIPSAWSWVFGDNGSTVGSTDRNPTHTYATNGSYTVSLTATNEYGNNTKTKTDYIVVGAGASAANFTANPTLVQAPSGIVTFTDTSTNSPTSWSWSFGDGGTDTTHQNPTHTYTKAGQYDVTLTVVGTGGSATTTKQNYILVSFPDVPIAPEFWALRQILACVDAGIVAGYPDGTYAPATIVTRDQMAVYIARALAGSDAAVPAGPAASDFTDVGTDYWAYKYIEYAKDKSIVTGYPDGTYQPQNQVTRDQMAVYVSRAVVNPTGDTGLASYTPPTSPSFPDVATNYWAFKYIEYAKAHSIVNGYPDGTYGPTNPVTRDQMAVYMQHAFGLPMAQ